MKQLESFGPRRRSHKFTPVAWWIVHKRPSGLNLDQVEQEALEFIFLSKEILEECSDKVICKRPHFRLWSFDQDLTRAATALSDLAPPTIAKDE